MKVWTIVFTQQVQREIQNIYDYIAYDALEPDNAYSQIERIWAMAYSLDTMPHRYKQIDIPQFAALGWRVVPVDRYLLLYRTIDDKAVVEIMNVMHGSQDMLSFLLRSL